MSLAKLKKGNNVFVKKFDENKKLYHDLVEKGQHPKVLWVGCSDSRVVPEFTVNADAGDLFVIRNIANIIPPAEADENCTSSVLEYAVLHLNIEHIIICGHTGCGGINALIDGTPKDSKIHDWLKHACPTQEITKKPDSDSLELVTIKENILFQAKNILTFEYIEKKVNQNEINIHKWLYDMHSGKISFFDEIDNNWHQFF
ncbi:MAG: carbonic anhydrase [Candidatus Tenebribacter mawsonii]|nr:carbonic anhydrase [Candidatus Tenebribacter mawsonii]